MVNEENPRNFLINPHMMPLFYARSTFEGHGPTEGSLTSARAITQLRQFYMQMVDFEDHDNFFLNWKQNMGRYEKEMMLRVEQLTGPNNRDSQNKQKKEDEILSELVLGHSDMSFRHWVFNDQQGVVIYGEKRGQQDRIDILKLKKYRHQMVKDSRDEMPLSTEQDLRNTSFVNSIT